MKSERFLKMINAILPTNVFIVDDEPLDNMIFKMLVKRVNGDINVETINNGAKAISDLLQLSQTNPKALPDYIFLDLQMPVMNGWEFLDEYERLNLDRFKKTHIYILSSSIFSDDITKSKSNSLVEDFINKPLNVEDLRSILKAA